MFERTLKQPSYRPFTDYQEGWAETRLFPNTANMYNMGRGALKLDLKLVYKRADYKLCITRNEEKADIPLHRNYFCNASHIREL